MGRGCATNVVPVPAAAPSPATLPLDRERLCMGDAAPLAAATLVVDCVATVAMFVLTAAAAVVLTAATVAAAAPAL